MSGTGASARTGTATGTAAGTVTTKVPARLDRLPWSRWHWMIVIGLGTVWIPAAGGISGPLIFAGLTSSGVVSDAVLAFSIGAGLMVAAGLVAVFYAVAAEGRSLEDIATPLSARAAEPDLAR
ncbi:hypothetical protein ACFQ7B_16620 [Streptomyces erythrochromogenes]|uniref:hypothetical protein n=1 Tax=Streptomyces erythrochromogenes TaxID=285574 RepID=UPI0036C8C278